MGNDVVDLLDDALGVLRDHLHVKRDRSGETTVGGAYEAIERAVRTHAGAEACRSSSGPRHGRAPLPSPRRAGLRVRPAQRAWDPGVFRSLFHGNDERVDVESLGLTATALHDVVTSYLG